MSDETPTTAVRVEDATHPTKKMTIKDHLQTVDFKTQVQMALPPGFTAEKFVRVSMNAMIRNPEISACSQASVFRCLLDLASLGLEADGRRAHLIPFGKVNPVCTLIIDYKGLVELALRSGNISKIHADIICENDIFKHDAGEIQSHTYDITKTRGSVIGVYVITQTKDGVKQASIMSRMEVELIRKRSKCGQSGPWVMDWNEQAKKTVFRRHSKWIVLSPEIREAYDLDTSDYEEPTVTRRVVSSEEDPLLSGNPEETKK